MHAMLGRIALISTFCCAGKQYEYFPVILWVVGIQGVLMISIRHTHTFV